MEQVIPSLAELYARLPEEERIITDVLRQIIREQLPPYCRERLSHGVPSYYGKKAICIIWPASVKGGGIREGVLLGFWQGNRLADKQSYLTSGTNTRIFYRIYKKAEDIREAPLRRLLREAVELDQPGGLSIRRPVRSRGRGN